MKSECSAQSTLSGAVSCREFLVGSMASAAAATLCRNASADTAVADVDIRLQSSVALA
jgi:hypothetical protein